MTDLAPLVDLNAATRDALQPPCEVRVTTNCPIHGTHHHPCEQPAAWIIRGHPHDGPALICDGHQQAAMAGDGRLRCSTCLRMYRRSELTVEPI